MAVATAYRQIILNDRNVPIIADTTMKVVELVMAQRAYGWSPEELHFQHPYLSMSQICAALAYYWDHKDEIDASIEESLRFADWARMSAGPSPIAAKVAKGRGQS
jgi:uncharacterized protein (DUF433 family)